MNQKMAFSILQDVKRVFNTIGLDFWLNLGTVLGLHRDNKFIDLPGEDIDIGTIFEGGTSALPQHLKNIGFNMQEVRTLDNRLVHISTNRDGIHVCFDIYHQYPENKFFYFTESYVYYFFHPVTLVSNKYSIKLKGEFFPIPGPEVLYLEFQYGPNWRTPLKKMVPAHLSHTKESIVVKEGAKL